MSDAVSQLYHRFRDDRIRRSRACRAYRDAMSSGRRERIRTTAKPRSSTRCRSPRPHHPTDKTYADQLKAGAILDTLIATPAATIPAWRTTSSTATTCRRWPTARSKRRGATRRSRRRRRTRCTCRRTRSRASATGRNRSTPTSRPARSRGEKAPTAEELHAMDYRTWRATCRPGAGRAARRGMLDALPEVRSTLRCQTPSDPAAPGVRQASRAGGDPGALCARARARGPTPRSSTPHAEQHFRTPMR